MAVRTDAVPSGFRALTLAPAHRPVKTRGSAPGSRARLPSGPTRSPQSPDSYPPLTALDRIEMRDPITEPPPRTPGRRSSAAPDCPPQPSRRHPRRARADIPALRLPSPRLAGQEILIAHVTHYPRQTPEAAPPRAIIEQPAP